MEFNYIKNILLFLSIYHDICTTNLERNVWQGELIVWAWDRKGLVPVFKKNSTVKGMLKCVKEFHFVDNVRNLEFFLAVYVSIGFVLGNIEIVLFQEISIPRHRRCLGLSPPPFHTFLLKVWLLRPSSPSEFPITFLGMGMDIFWNHTFSGNKLHCPVIKCIITWYLNKWFLYKRGLPCQSTSTNN